MCVQGMWFWGGGQRQGDYTDEEFGKNPNLEVGGLSKQIKDTSRGLFQEMHVSKDMEWGLNDTRRSAYGQVEKIRWVEANVLN